MDFALSEEQEALQGLARQILEDRATPERLKQVEAGDEGIDRDLWSELATANLIGACLPEKYGGSGMGLGELSLLLAEVGRCVAPVPILPTVALGALPIAEFGTEAQRERWLPRVANGEIFLTAALQEAASDDPMRPTTTVERTAAGWRLTGEKICVPLGPLAERVLVAARVAAGDVGIFLLDASSPRVSCELQDATNAEPQYRLRFDAVELSDEDVLCEPGAAARDALEWITLRASVALCAVQSGVAERALRITADYTTERKQFDRPIGSFQAVHQRAADAYIDVEAMRLTLWQAVSRLERGEDAAASVRVAGFWACEGGNRVVFAAQHLHGGIGLDLDYPVHRYYLWARQHSLMLGGAELELERLGEQIETLPL